MDYSLKDLQPLIIFALGAASNSLIQWRQRVRDQTRTWAIKQAEELYNPLLESATRTLWTVDYHEWTDHRDYGAWIKMFPEEVRPLVLSKAHLASPSLLDAVDALLESIEGIKAWISTQTMLMRKLGSRSPSRSL